VTTRLQDLLYAKYTKRQQLALFNVETLSDRITIIQRVVVYLVCI